jgi:hypothetical protein
MMCNQANELVALLSHGSNILLNVVLYNWLLRQQRLSIGTQWTQQMHYNLLNELDPM